MPRSNITVYTLSECGVTNRIHLTLFYKLIPKPTTLSNIWRNYYLDNKTRLDKLKGTAYLELLGANKHTNSARKPPY